MLYSLGLKLVDLSLHLVGNFNSKIKKGVAGRKQTFSKLSSSVSPTDKTIWFHCASLGEYEQGLPVFKDIRKTHPGHKIILSFFSPSGYEIRQNSEIADVVIYLPLDTVSNAKRFFDIFTPELTVFVKYDIWPNFLLELRKRGGKAILISALLRPNQSFFKFYGSRLKQALMSFEHIFVQDENSKTLLNSIDYKAVTITGDTRFDRVSQQLEQDNSIPFIQEFKADSLCVVIGSSWPEDEAILMHFINDNASKNIKFIIAPHNIKPDLISNLEAKCNQAVIKFSNKDQSNLPDYNIFILDTIGILTKVYSYADIAYVGGAMGATGLHNILEPSVFGAPVIIGKNHKKFPEAKLMIDNGGVFSVSNESQLQTTLRHLINDNESRMKYGKLNSSFILKHKGAVKKIAQYLENA